MRNGSRERLMKRIAIGAMCLAATVVYADGQSEELIDETAIRLADMEVIDVTSEKRPIEGDEELDADIEAILDEANRSRKMKPTSK